jgi:hypothetical protein
LGLSRRESLQLVEEELKKLQEYDASHTGCINGVPTCDGCGARPQECWHTCGGGDHFRGACSACDEALNSYTVGRRLGGQSLKGACCKKGESVSSANGSIECQLAPDSAYRHGGNYHECVLIPDPVVSSGGENAQPSQSLAHEHHQTSDASWYRPKCESGGQACTSHNGPMECWSLCNETTGYCSACDSLDGVRGACCSVDSNMTQFPECRYLDQDGYQDTQEFASVRPVRYFNPHTSYHQCVRTEVPKCTGCEGTRPGECQANDRSNACTAEGLCANCDSPGGTPGACCKKDINGNVTTCNGMEIPNNFFIYDTADYHQCVITTNARPTYASPPTPSPTAIPTPAPTWGYDTYSNKQCGGGFFDDSYTFNISSNCNGFQNITDLDACWEKCESNLLPAGDCEHQTNVAPCRAVLFSPCVSPCQGTGGTCYLYAHCDLQNSSGAQVRVSHEPAAPAPTQAPTAFVNFPDHACYNDDNNSDRYTYIVPSATNAGCNGWSGLSEADCMDKCIMNEVPAWCTIPGSPTCAGIEYGTADKQYGEVSYCQLFSHCTLFPVSSDSGVHIWVKGSPSGSIKASCASALAENSTLCSARGWSPKSSEPANRAACPTQPACDVNDCCEIPTPSPTPSPSHSPSDAPTPPTASPAPQAIPGTTSTPSPTALAASVWEGALPENVVCEGDSNNATHCLAWYIWITHPRWQCGRYQNRADAETKFNTLQGTRYSVAMFNTEPKELKFYGVLPFWNWNTMRRMCTTALNVNYDGQGDYNYKNGSWVPHYHVDEFGGSPPRRRRALNASRA